MTLHCGNWNAGQVLTVSELARIVGKADSYVRQHVRRGHLSVTKDGTRTLIDPEEAIRWSQERNLPFLSPVPFTSALSSPPRAARMTAIIRRDGDTTADNVYTLIRHRRADALGPWASPHSGEWKTEDLGHDLCRLTLDSTFDECRALADEAVEGGSVELADIRCKYDLFSHPRRHWAYRDDRPNAKASMKSPFHAHSANITEYWATESEGRASLSRSLDELPADVKITVPSARASEIWPDRIGNLVIAGAEDGHTFDLHVDGFRSLAFHAGGAEVHPGAFNATVWAYHCGDEVFHRELPVEFGNRKFILPCNPDRIGFAVYRTSDGQCVDFRDSSLVVSIDIDISVSSEPSLQLTDDKRRPFHTVPRSTRSLLQIDGNKHAPEIDQTLRRRMLQRHAAESDAEAKRAGDVVRCDPQDFNEAAKHLIALVGRDVAAKGLIYLADRYFPSLAGDAAGVRLVTDMLAASNECRLNILCTETPAEHPSPWWTALPTHLTEHMTVRSFLKRDRKPAFHDRFLVTAERERLFTHSINGWKKDGVTFVTLPFNVYRTHAEYLWSQPLQSTSANFYVEEYPQ